MAKKITSPIKNAIEITSHIAQGDFSAKLEVVSHDEVGMLAEAFNEMSTKLATSITQLELSEKKTEEARDFLENVINTSVDGILIVDSRGYIKRANAALEKMVGYSQDELIGKHPAELSSKDEEHQQITAEMVIHLYEKGFVESAEAVWIRKDGSTFPVEANMALLKDERGTILGGVSAIRDITDRKRYQEELKRSKEELEIRVEERTSELMQAKEAAEAGSPKIPATDAMIFCAERISPSLTISIKPPDSSRAATAFCQLAGFPIRIAVATVSGFSMA